MDIASGIAAATNALGIAKALRDVEKSYDAVTYKQQVVELFDALSDTKLALIEAKEANHQLGDELERLKRTMKRAQSLVEGDGGYQYAKDENDEMDGYPFCPKCLHGGALSQLKQNVVVDAAKCPVCDREFKPVTCYLTASKNGGVSTTAVTVRNEKRKRASEENSRRFAELNQGTSLFPSRGTW